MLGHEVPRHQLISLLTSRWTRPVTTLIAPAGYGKSTAIAQSVRANLVSPRGVDIWITCGPDRCDASAISAAISTAVDPEAPAPERDTDPFQTARSSLRSLSPLNGCVILDDIHRLDAGGSAIELVSSLIRDLPANMSLLLAGRRLPSMPLARLRAADGVFEIEPGQLLLDDTEIARLAASLGRAPGSIRDFGGWPALVRLALTAPMHTTADYLIEEVAHHLAPADRAVLLALATAGPSDQATVEELVGRPINPDRLLATLPLLSRGPDGRLQAHQLWEQDLIDLLDLDEVEQMRRRALAVVEASGDVVRLGDLAVRFGDPVVLGRAALRLVGADIGGSVVETATRWSAAVPPGAADLPAFQLLDAAIRVSRDLDDAVASASIDLALDALIEAGDGFGAGAAVKLAVLIAVPRNDFGRVLELAARARDLPGVQDDPFLAGLLASTDAALTELGGDPEGALAVLTRHAERPGSEPGVMQVYQQVQLLNKLGRADEAVEVADAAVERLSAPSLQPLPAFTRFLAGDPTGYQSEARYETPEAGSSSRWRFEALLVATVFRASAGHVIEMDQAWVAALTLRPDPSPDIDAALAVAEAIRAVGHRDEPAARAILERLVASHGITDPAVDGRLRAYLAVPYICLPQLRDHWSTGPMGPSRERVRQVAELLEAARSGGLGRRSPLPGSDQILTSLPLPWSVELAARVAGIGNRAGRRLAEGLIDRTGPACQRELRWLSEHGDSNVAGGAATLLASIPIAPGTSLRIEVLGPARVLIDGVVQDRPELRRDRVRELLTLLVLEADLTRDRAIDLLWPDRDPRAGARNLRVTLSHLRRALEPQRAAGQATFHLRTDGRRLRLVDSDSLQVDLWDFRRYMEAGQPDLAADLWRGPVLDAVPDHPDLSVEVEALTVVVVDASLTAGEWSLAAGDVDGAARRAEQVLASAPLTERAHRLAIAAQIHRGDRARTRSCLVRAGEALRELGAGPEPETMILQRQAVARFGFESSFAEAPAPSRT